MDGSMQYMRCSSRRSAASSGARQLKLSSATLFGRVREFSSPPGRAKGGAPREQLWLPHCISRYGLDMAHRHSREARSRHA
jgi:hypothetical protein